MDMKFSELIKILKSKDEAVPRIEEWKESIARELQYPDGLRIVERFAGALFTGQLIILSGPPGTGKTSLPRAFADAIGAKVRLIPVQPNWTDNQDLMGYYNPVKNDGEGGYTTTPFLDAMLEALDDPDDIYFVVLDEMNLAHIEYYFSTMLSIMESPEKIITLYSRRLQPQNPGKGVVPCEIKYPENLQIIGTLNMDETTKGISPKVVDRSYILEIPSDSEIADCDHDLPILNNDGDDIDDGFEEIKSFFNESFDIALSYRLKKQYKKMSERSFVTVDDYVAGKVLPMIRDNRRDEVVDFPDETYHITIEKARRMIKKMGDEDVRYDFWVTD